MIQHEIFEKRPLLDGRGNIAEPGFARRPLPVYRRIDIKAPAWRIKEWDYYLINNGHFALALTVDDNGYMGLDSIGFLNFDEGWHKAVSPMCALPMGRRRMPESSVSGDVYARGKGYEISFCIEDGYRVLSFHMDDFLDGAPIFGQVVLSAEPPESMVICTPFRQQGHFYYNRKINCLRAEGRVTVGGRRYTFTPDSAFAVLDWGRGVWPYRCHWYWSSASGLADGVPVGWNLGYGFGETTAATENMLFYDGRAHKLGRVSFGIPQKDGKPDYMSPWLFTSSDGRLLLDFIPVLDRASLTAAGPISSDQHQVFGRFCGKLVLDDGRVVEVKDLPGFAEDIVNRW